MQLHIYKTPEEVTTTLAEWITALIEKTLLVKEKFTIALSGGSTPKSLYKKLAASPYKEKIHWSKIHFFWGDERYVPFEDDKNNARMAYETLLNNINVPVGNIHVMRTDIEANLSAAEYEKILHNYFDDAITTFDLVLLGMGEDGHTLSLFPHSDFLTKNKIWVDVVFSQEQQNHRITLMPSLVNRSGSIAFLITGSDKATALQQVLQGKYQPHIFPSQIIKPANGELHFFIDEAAAAGLLK